MQQLAVSPEDFRRLERYLPRGLASGPSALPTDRAAGYLAQLVLSQRLVPGEKIPMDEIAERIGVSRTPVREALRLLETEGLVASLTNRGFVVRRLEAEDIGHLYDARACIEANMVRQAFTRRTRAFVQELKALHRIYASLLAGSGDRRRLGMVVDKAFHVRIAEQAANPYLTAMLANMFDRLILTRPLEDFPLHRMQEAVEEHAALTTAFEKGSARGVDEAMKRNVNNGGIAIVAHMVAARDFGFRQHTNNSDNEEQER
jgi:DNA-binding GntR family transcriptional regulator